MCSCLTMEVLDFADMLPRFVKLGVSIAKDVLAFCRLTVSLLFLSVSLVGYGLSLLSQLARGTKFTLFLT